VRDTVICNKSKLLYCTSSSSSSFFVDNRERNFTMRNFLIPFKSRVSSRERRKNFQYSTPPHQTWHTKCVIQKNIAWKKKITSSGVSEREEKFKSQDHGQERERKEMLLVAICCMPHVGHNTRLEKKGFSSFCILSLACSYSLALWIWLFRSRFILYNFFLHTVIRGMVSMVSFNSLSLSHSLN
jgi:hypothetical protein